MNKIIKAEYGKVVVDAEDISIILSLCEDSIDEDSDPEFTDALEAINEACNDNQQHILLCNKSIQAIKDSYKLLILSKFIIDNDEDREVVDETTDKLKELFPFVKETA
jgi:uncharacterized protein Yka (UPF0111/DUF47 family)